MTEVCVPEDILSQPRLSGIEFRVHATTNITDRVEREDEDDPSLLIRVGPQGQC